MQDAAADAQAPFARYRISSHAPLDAIAGRSQCPGCNKKRKHYCYDCLRPMNPEGEVPKVELPCDVHVIKHPQEHNSKSTGVHAPILSAARLISYEKDVELPTYDPSSTVLLFPSPRSTSLRDMGAKLQGVKVAIIVDCTVRSEPPQSPFALIDCVCVRARARVSCQRRRACVCMPGCLAVHLSLPTQKPRLLIADRVARCLLRHDSGRWPTASCQTSG